MRRRWFIALLAIVISVEAPVWGQQGAAAVNATAQKPEPAKVGSYSLVVTTLEPSAATHWLNPPATIHVTGGTVRAPAETAGNLTVPAQYAIEDFGAPRWECVASALQPHGCDALDRTDLTIRDPHTLGYRIVSHGAAVELRINLQVDDLLPVSHREPGADWHAGDVIFVSVPKATPAYRFVSETLVGLWNGEPIVFEAGKPLPASAKKGLEDLKVHQDLGDAVLYSYRVK
ncbi:MAG: hypothetical protein ACRD3N_11510 [Terracidiphilus sp.]